MKFINCILFFFFCNLITAQPKQDVQLGQEYYINGDFEKALFYYKKIYKKDDSKIFYTRYLDCLIKTDDKKGAEKLMQKRIKAENQNIDLKLNLAQFYLDEQKEEKANAIFEKILKNVNYNLNDIQKTYKSFVAVNQLFWAKKTLDQARQKNKTGTLLNKDFASLYSLMGEEDKMIKEMFDLVNDDSFYKNEVIKFFIPRINFNNKESSLFNKFKTELLKRNQKNSDKIVYTELLIWFFIQSENYNAALTQSIGLDKRFNLRGEQVVNIGKLFLNNKHYNSAKKAFSYVISLGKENESYHYAESLKLKCLFLDITETNQYNQEDLNTCISEFQKIIKKQGNNRKNIPLIIQLSHIYAFYANSPDPAMESLNNALEFPYMSDMQKAEIKMKLADINVVMGDIWEASLLYMQIEEDFKFESIGEQAKYKNAKIFYYNGEFEYAQSQLNILKESTSKLIANDAMELSVLITENYGADSNYIAMNWFAKAELLIAQHLYIDAFLTFDTIARVYPASGLKDEILYRKGKAMEEQGKWSDALSYYQKLIENHAFDILADNALFRIGDIYHFKIKDIQKASESYKRIMVEYPGSLYTTEARKRFRILRGDKISDDNPEYRKWNN